MLRGMFGSPIRPWLFVLAGVVGSAARGEPRSLVVRADPPIVVVAQGGSRVSLAIRSGAAADVDAFTWSQVPDRINPLRTKGQARIEGTGASVTAVLPAPSSTRGCCSLTPSGPR